MSTLKLHNDNMHNILYTSDITNMGTRSITMSASKFHNTYGIQEICTKFSSENPDGKASLERPRGRQKDRQCTHKRNTGPRSRNHCCRGKSISTAYSECVSAALVIQHAERMRRIIVSCGLSGSTTFFHVIS
jgi:hypothetical protein